MKQGIVLFAHGSRDPHWAQPLEQLASSLSRRMPACEVELAFLEHMRPSLHEAVGTLRARAVRRARIVPVFLGSGGHLKEDLPRLAREAAAAHGDVEIVLESAIGERASVIEAIADAIAAGPPSA